MKTVQRVVSFVSVDPVAITVIQPGDTPSYVVPGVYPTRDFDQTDQYLVMREGSRLIHICTATTIGTTINRLCAIDACHAT